MSSILYLSIVVGGFLVGGASWLILRGPVRHLIEEMQFDRARMLFRGQREVLEMRFLIALERIDPIDRLRWEDACWHDEIVWARDRRSRRVLALVGVHFGHEAFTAASETPHARRHPLPHATALFEYHKGRWHAEGKRLDEIRPDEAFLTHLQFEPVELPQRRG